MSSTSLKNIALIGSGGIGTTILRALVETKKVNAIVLTRASSNPKTLPPDLSAVPVIRVDYADVPAVAAILKSHDIEIVISALSNTPAFQAQFALADAAKASGTVKLFVPSEWGIPTEGAKQRGPDNMFALKDAVACKQSISMKHGIELLIFVTLSAFESDWIALYKVLGELLLELIKHIYPGLISPCRRDSLLNTSFGFLGPTP